MRGTCGRGRPAGWRARRRLLAVAALALFVSGCSGLGTRYLEIPFFFEYDPEPETGEVRTTIPLLLSGHFENKKRDEERTYFLFPFFSAIREGKERTYRILTAPVYQKRIDHRGFEDIDVVAGPVLWGTSADEGSYLAVLPFGGTIKGLLGKDYGVFVTPLFWYLEERTTVGMFKSYHMPFPFVNWVSGGGRSGFRIWPFYGHYERYDREGRQAYDRTWILWPFWQTLRNNMNTQSGEQWMWFFFPFVGRGGGPNHSQWTVLWPLFHYIERTRHSTTDPYWEIKAPFPFFIYGKGKYRSRFDLWPFYGQKKRYVPMLSGTAWDRFERRFVGGPLFRWEHHETKTFDDTKWWLLPIVWSFSRRNKETGAVSRTFRIWPLLRYRRFADGRTTLNLIAPLWFDDTDPEGVFEQIYNPLTRIYEHADEKGGGERLRLLWGLYHSFESPERDDLAIHPLFWDDETKDGGEHDLGLLFGLFQYHRRGKKKALRFFWLPEWPTWETDDVD